MSWKYKRSDSALCDYQIVSDSVVIAGEHGIEEEKHAEMISACEDLFSACVKLVHWNGKRDGDNNLLAAEFQNAEIAEAMRAIAKAGFPYPMILTSTQT